MDNCNCIWLSNNKSPFLIPNMDKTPNPAKNSINLRIFLNHPAMNVFCMSKKFIFCIFYHTHQLLSWVLHIIGNFCLVSHTPPAHWRYSICPCVVEVFLASLSGEQSPYSLQLTFIQLHYHNFPFLSFFQWKSIWTIQYIN